MAVQDPTQTAEAESQTEDDKSALVDRLAAIDEATRPRINPKSGNVIVAFYDGVPREFFRMVREESVAEPFSHSIYLVDDHSVNFRFRHEED